MAHTDLHCIVLYLRNMSNKWVIAVFILVVIAAAWWGLVSYSPPASPQAAQQELRIPPADTHYAPPATLAVNHSVVNGANVYSGTLPIRSCNTFSGGLSASGGDPVHVQLNFKIFDGDGTCLGSSAAEDTPQPFSMSFSSKASTATPIVDSVSINDAAVPFKLVEGR